ncbi:MAG: LytTR family DNA-binding domain-containing protein [Luteimonas sp.]
MHPHVPSSYDRFLPWKRTFEVGYWLAVTLLNGVVNSITVLMDIRRVGLDFAEWEPAVWEMSSGVSMLALVPAVVWFTRAFPLHWDNWRRRLLWHLPASMAFSLVHVLVMVGLRVLVYRTQAMEYDFSPWHTELFYEYLKDARSYAGMVALIELYRFILRRSQGEASLLDAPDEGPPLEPVDRPERFLVRKLGREFLVAASDIEWLQASGNYVNLRVRGHDYPLRSTIAGIEATLDPRLFVRIHRSYIVNLDHLASIEPLDTGDARIHLKDGGVLPCSRRQRDALRGRVGAAA